MNLSIFLIALFAHKVQSVAFNCAFNQNSPTSYFCFARNLTIISRDDRTVMEISGVHEIGKSNVDVNAISISEKVVNFFPLQLSNFFPNLEIIYFLKNTLSEILSSDLEQFGGKLVRFVFSGNDIEVLQANLFKFNPNIEVIFLDHNNIKHIEDGAFAGMPKLERLYLNNNPCINDGTFDKSLEVLISEAEFKCKDEMRTKVKNLNAKIETLQEKNLQLEGKLKEIEEKLESFEGKCS